MIKGRNAIITRFTYDKEAVKTEEYWWRYEFYKNKVLPRLEKQTNQNFDLWFNCNPWQDKEVKELGVNVFRVDTKNARPGKYSNGVFKFVSWSAVRGLPKYEIQTALDSDDFVEPYFNDIILKLSKGDKRIHLSFQPIKLDISTDKRYRMHPDSPHFYHAWRGSPVFSIYQPSGEFYYVYDRSHAKMPKITDKSIKIENEVYMVIHKDNATNEIIESDILI
jgi:hypothetical protein